MKKVTNRAFAVLLLSALVICGMVVYVLRYIDNGQNWALYFASANSGSSGEVLDRKGVRLAYFDATHYLYADEEITRRSCYHVTGDYWGRTGTGVLTTFWNDMQGFSLITGTTRSSSGKFTLNIDSGINNVAYRELKGRPGAVLVCNYKTGELLGMVSTPSVDPLDALSEPEDGAYINRCLSATFTPGSVFKLITAAAAIENLSNINSRSYYCEGEYEIAGVKIKCSGTHYTQNFEQALANSCNVAFAQIAVSLGQDTMVKYVRDYGFLDAHELDGIPTAAGSYPTEFVGDPELGWSGIGQSTDMICPYSMLRYVSAIANGGTLCEPRLVKTDDKPKTVQLMEASTAEKLGRMMSYNVSYHYGTERFPGLNLCAKTGTAELGDGTSHAWFAGYLDDYEHPYAFVVLVEHGGGGLDTAGSIANEVLQYAKENNI